QNFSLPTFAKMKKDIAARLAHKKPYQRINPEQQIDLLIVVNQMLTGFDSKCINTLYLDKVIEYESIIQAFSRTNRLFGADKPFGTIKSYRKPHTMKDNIEKAVKLYSGDKVFGLFADKLPKNIEMLNSIFNEIKLLFENAGEANFDRLPENDEEKAQFALLFNRLNAYLEAAKVQGLSLKQQDYSFKDEKGKKFTLSLVFDETTYFILLQRYKELTGNSGGTKPSAIPYDIKGYITEIDTGKIDNDYMNSRFQKYLKLLNNKADAEQMQAVKEELHKTFATLNQEEQKYANIFLHDIESGNVEISENLDLRAYINRYIIQAKNDAIAKIATALGVDESKLREMVNLYLNEDNINEYGRFDELRKTINKPLAKEYFEKQEGTTLSQKDANLKAAKLLREFILRGGFEA
ncbi:MAG: type I restriction endonuclease subunit R, partial [Neisseriaceae bacterium]|nr:type I restriction endonuclease subunit R [Neisseriaceae bacterium]